MKSLFPEMEREILDDRKAAKREAKQIARQRLLTRDFTWTINRLLECGPSTEFTLCFLKMEELQKDDPIEKVMDVIGDLHWLWSAGKLWRRKMGVHIGSGEMSYEYGIRKVHKKSK